MIKAAPAIWVLKLATTCALLLACCWVAPRLFKNLPQFPPTTTDEEQFVNLNRYFQLPVADVALVGSSLTFRLKEQYFEEGNVRNVALSGGSSLTGLAVIDAAQARRPRIIAVETNILTRGIDDNLFQKFKYSGRADDMLRPLRTLAAFYQTRVFRDQPAFDAEKRRGVLSAPAVAYDNAKSIKQILLEWNKPIYEDAITRDAKALKALIERLEASGITVYLYELPMAPAVDESGYVKTTRATLERVFGPVNNRWLRLVYPADELRWDDGAHLDDRSAIIISSSLEKAIVKRNGL